MNYYRNPANNQVFGYDPETQQALIDAALAAGWVNITGSWPLPPSDDEKKQACKAQAKGLLEATDYSQLPDVASRLANAVDFAVYREQVRVLYLTPVVDPVWPTTPKAVWST